MVSISGAAAPLAQEQGGFSGFRLLSLLDADEHHTEFAVFQGASYFRARAANQWYGSSARGLAVDVGMPLPEEFPRFRKFWIRQPSTTDRSIELWALMDSPAEAGAYRFVVTPGIETVIDIEAQLWFRFGVQKLGVAPLTSMWMWDAATKPEGDHRPEVHDSDGLLIASGDGAWIWRPLRRPERPCVSKWPLAGVAGFGLLQRDRDASHYDDKEAHYDRRPSIWVRPTSDWGPGHIELLELPTEHEGGDNIGAYWVSDEPVKSHGHRTLNYRVAFGDGPRQSGPAWRVANTIMAPGSAGAKILEVTFEPATQTGDDGVFEPRLWCNGGRFEKIEVTSADQTRRVLRATYYPPPHADAQLEAQLVAGDGTVSEKWSYRWMHN